MSRWEQLITSPVTIGFARVFTSRWVSIPVTISSLAYGIWSIQNGHWFYLMLSQYNVMTYGKWAVFGPPKHLSEEVPND